MTSGCGFDAHSWYQKLTINVDTPVGTKSAYSVTKVSKVDSDRWWVPPEAHGVNDGLIGEAISLNLGGGRYVFSLLSGGVRNTHIAQNVFAKEIGHTGKILNWSKWPKWVIDLTQIQHRGVFKREHYPLLGTFTDINDPKTVMRVDPDDMDDALGCSKPQLAKYFPWRAQGRTWRQWYKFEAFREALFDAGEEADLPDDLSRYAILDKFNWAINHGIAKETEPKYMPPPKDYEVDKLQLASLWSTIRAKYDKKLLRKMYRQHRNTAVMLRKAYLARGRDTSDDCPRLKSLTLEITDEPVTNCKVEKVLGWQKSCLLQE